MQAASRYLSTPAQSEEGRGELGLERSMLGVHLRLQGFSDFVLIGSDLASGRRRGMVEVEARKENALLLFD